MTVAFLSVGLAIIALGGVLRASARSDVRARLIQATSLVAGVGLVVSGVFRTGVTPVSEEIHSSASGLGTIALLGMSVAYSLLLLHEGSRFRGYFGWALALTATGVAAISPVLHETRWTGLSQRMLWAVLVIWLLWASLDSGPAGVRRLTP